MSDELKTLANSFREWKENKTHSTQKMPDSIRLKIYNAEKKFGRKVVCELLNIASSDLSKTLKKVEQYNLKEYESSNNKSYELINLTDAVDSAAFTPIEQKKQDHHNQRQLIKENPRKGFVLKLQGAINLKISFWRLK